MGDRVWLHKSAPFEEAQQFDVDYYLRVSSAERIEMIQILREAYFKLKGLAAGENGKSLRRVFRIVKQT